MSAFDPKRTWALPTPSHHPIPYRGLSIGATMRRREFITLIGGVAAIPLVAGAWHRELGRPLLYERGVAVLV